MVVRRLAVLVAVLFIAAIPAMSAAQNADSAGFAGETDAKDVMDRLRSHGGTASAARDYGKPEWIQMPTVVSKPGTGTLLGGGAEVSFFRGNPATTHASTIVGTLAASFSGNVSAGLRLTVHGADNRWLFVGDNRFEYATQRSFGLGTSSLSSAQFGAVTLSPRINDVAFRRIAKGLYAGVGLHVSRYDHVAPTSGEEAAWNGSAYAEYSTLHGFDLGGQGSAGPSLDIRFDNRDSSVSASRGALVAASYRLNAKGLLGGASAWQKLTLDVRSYRSLDGRSRHVLAAWAYADLVTGGVAPYFDLPANGMDMQGRTGRGYAVGRFRGEQLAYAEVEYRTTLTSNGLIGMVAFVNMTTVSNRSTGERLFQSVAPGAGVGLRLLADKYSRTSVCVDVGIGRNGSHGVYVGLQETF